jgi:hypothetical protein
LIIFDILLRLIFPKIQDVRGEDSSKALRKVICFTKKISPFLIAFATHYLPPPFLFKFHKARIFPPPSTRNLPTPNTRKIEKKSERKQEKNRRKEGIYEKEKPCLQLGYLNANKEKM